VHVLFLLYQRTSLEISSMISTVEQLPTLLFVKLLTVDALAFEAIHRLSLSCHNIMTTEMCSYFMKGIKVAMQSIEDPVNLCTYLSI